MVYHKFSGPAAVKARTVSRYLRMVALQLLIEVPYV